MSYESLKTQFGRQHLYIVEIDLDYCSLTHGSSPCTATETGDSKCYNTLESCNDVPNYDKTTKTFRFCEPVSPHPIGLNAMPYIKSLSIAPSEIDVGGGLGVRSKVSIKFSDHPHSDIDIDPYISDRTFIALERGTFWTKLRARNPNYQFRELRVLSGYIEDGEYSASNFETRYYVIESMNASGGQCTITAKDPLKLASSGKALAPAPSTGQLSADISDTATSATLNPSGVGNDEYSASGKVLINKEVMSFTRSGDVLTLTRAQNNTVAQEHSQNDTVQECLEYSSEQVNVIVEDLLTTYAGIDSSFISTATWQNEIDTYISGLLSGIVVKPTDIYKLLKELALDSPHYLWWNEKEQKIELTALKPPPSTADTLNMSDHHIANSVTVRDRSDLRKSSIYINYGQFDPTKKIDDSGNFQRTYARIDSDSVSKYGSDEVKTVYSRWINAGNKAAAVQLSALYGRRFANIPREIELSLDAKDSDVWVGQSKNINHRDIVDFSGSPTDTTFQIISARESKTFDYKALEFVYGDSLPDDEGGGDPSVDLVYPVESNNINLRTLYDANYPSPDGSTQAKFIIDPSVNIGSTSISTYSIDTGSWPSGATLTLVVNGYVCGKGGKGGHASGTPAAEDGGTAIILNHDLELVNNNIIGGGGGGGGYDSDTSGSLSGGADGGGGAGITVGARGGGLTYSGGGSPTIRDAEPGQKETGGLGGRIVAIVGSDELFVTAGDGGDLGEAGQTKDGTGGAAGDAIDKNGYTLTQTVAGDIRGSIIA